MKKILNLYKSLFVLAILLITVIACDRDFTSIESDIEGIKNFNTASKKFPLVAYNNKLGPVQTNNLSSNLLGIYNDAIYGKTIASVVAQVTPTIYNFNFGDEPQIEKVILTIPYFTSSEGTDLEGNNLYSLDSLFGNEFVKLSIYENTYFLRDFDPETNLEESQKFYSNANQTINFNAHLGELFYEENYLPNPEQQEIDEGEVDDDGNPITETIAPSLRVELSNTNDFWGELFFFQDVNEDTDHPELSNQNNFKDYFRGLYFKIEDANNNGHSQMLDFSRGTIIVNYSYLLEVVDDEDVREDGIYRMNFTGNRLNILKNDPANMIIDIADANANPIDGDEMLYLKGGEGSIAIIELFNGLVEDNETGLDVPALEYFKNKKDTWLINEANLIFYVNQNVINGNGQEPDRVILYDIANNVPIVDYFFDSSTNTANPLNSKTNFSEKLVRDESKNGVKYKFRVTEHLNNILLRDSTNVKLGLLVTTNINYIQNAEVLNSEERISPAGAVLSPRGTVLLGSHQNVPEAKRVTLEIFYTEPNN